MSAKITNDRKYFYEAMFLFGQAAGADLGGCVAHLNEILARGHADVLATRKWDERRLAYEIKGQKRGLYLLVYFKTESRFVANIERDCNLSEKVIRTLILRADHMGEDEMRAADARKELELEIKMRGTAPAQPTDAPVAPVATEPQPA